MNPADYEFCCRFLEERSGLSLGENKGYLLEGRLVPIAKANGLADLSALVSAVRRSPNGPLADAMIEAMTTNETLFFRDKTPFEELKATILPPMLEARANTRRLRIWSAAASTGQEAYSLAIMLHDSFPQLADWRLEIVGTDLSQAALERARSGVYSQFEVQRGLPIQTLVKHFQQTPAGWKIQDHLRRGISFQLLNLMKPFQILGVFDIIFCRNVLIYFESPLKRDILERMERQLAPDGCVILGAAETVLGVTDRFERSIGCRAPIYVPKARIAIKSA
ncbi:MAG: protein-glutamate O-methyltransferase CheR [Planctomycetaceae bacterium]|nr:protein-glutamate O-methyltransferase CheR [Planctomycetaceae bacterium]